MNVAITRNYRVVCEQYEGKTTALVTFYCSSDKHNSGFARLKFLFFLTQLYRSCLMDFISYCYMFRLSVSATFR